MLARSECLIGRSSGCHVILDDGLVSRIHARITFQEDIPTVSDAGSANGVFLNGARLDAPATLNDGDTIRIGKQELLFRTQTLEAPRARLGAETLHGTAPGSRTQPQPEANPRSEPLLPAQEEALDAFSVLATVADRLLAQQRTDDAERMLKKPLDTFLERSRQEPVPHALADLAAQYAVRLAEASRKPLWANYIFELFAYQRRPLPSGVVDQLHTSLRKLPGFDLTRLRHYLAVLRAEQQRFDPNGRFLVQRIEGLERLVSF